MTMTTALSEFPGRHERHYRRRLDNPLYGERATTFDAEVLLEMQRRDHEELMAFLSALRGTVQQAVDLAVDSESQAVLDIKESLDRLYEQSAGLADDHAQNQSAIRDLVEVIMRNVERGASDDPAALGELAQERAAREAHFTLLRSPLVADLLHPDTGILAEDLAPTLLSASREDLEAALQLFDDTQLQSLCADAGQCLAGLAVGAPPEAADRLGRICEKAARVDTAPPSV
jgi:hypothetical protein